MRYILILLALSMFSASVHAATITCPWKRTDVFIETGPLLKQIAPSIPTYPRDMPAPDMGGDYDEQAPHVEWNELNEPQETIPTIVHCINLANPRQTVEITVPPDIKRCLLHQDRLICKSGTVSFPGYIDMVHLNAFTSNGQSTEILPIRHPDEHGLHLLWNNLDKSGQGKKLFASCTDKDDLHPDQPHQFEIPPNMKSCALSHRRFRCTATPDQHDLFWPKN